MQGGSTGRGQGPHLRRQEPTEAQSDRFGGGGWEGHGDYMKAKEAKLLRQQRTQQLSDCLSGVALHIDGLSGERVADLCELVVAHGGEYLQYGGRWTHMIANQLPAAKVKQLTAHVAQSRRSGRPVHVVREGWLLDSAAQRRRLSEASYLVDELRDPEQGTLRGFVHHQGTLPSAAAAAAPAVDAAGTALSGASAVAAPAVFRLAPEPSGEAASAASAAPHQHALSTFPAAKAGASAAGPSTTLGAPEMQAVLARGRTETTGLVLQSMRTEGVGGLIAHVDADAFFVQCHQVARPDLFPRHMPLAVQQHNDVIAVSALARHCGVTKHMVPAEARAKLQAAHGQLVHVPTDPATGRVTYRLYEDYSRQLLALWQQRASECDANAVIELHPSSKEEAWIDTALRDPEAACDFARRLREATRAQLGFDVSIGIAWCKVRRAAR